MELAELEASKGLGACDSFASDGSTVRSSGDGPAAMLNQESQQGEGEELLVVSVPAMPACPHDASHTCAG